jgi:hypothetical protein
VIDPVICTLAGLLDTDLKGGVYVAVAREAVVAPVTVMMGRFRCRTGSFGRAGSEGGVVRVD